MGSIDWTVSFFFHHTLRLILSGFIQLCKEVLAPSQYRQVINRECCLCSLRGLLGDSELSYLVTRLNPSTISENWDLGTWAKNSEFSKDQVQTVAMNCGFSKVTCGCHDYLYFLGPLLCCPPWTPPPLIVIMVGLSLWSY